MSYSEGVFEKSGYFALQLVQGARIEPVAPYSLVSARLYADAPTDAEKEDTTNALGTAVEKITSWSAVPGYTHEYRIAYAAISDPDPSADTRYEVYYWAVSLKFSSTGTTVHYVKPFVVWRAQALSSIARVAPLDVFTVESKLEDFYSNTISAKIELARTLVNVDLLAKNFDLHRVKFEDTFDLVRYKAVVLACKDLSNEPNDNWAVKAADYTEIYESLFKKIPVGYDFDDEGGVTPTEEARQGPAFMMR